MNELWPLEENKYIFLFYGETLPCAYSNVGACT